MGYEWVSKEPEMQPASLENTFRKTQWVLNGL